VQGGALGPSGTCVDQLEGDASSLSLNFKPGRIVTADFGGAVSSGHCAGPLGQDLQRILIRGRRNRSRAPTFDLRGSLPFTAGPFSGTLTSTLLLAPQPMAPGLPASFVSGGIGSGPVPQQHRQLVEQVILRYRVTASATTFTIAFGGERGPFCHALGTCQAYGSLMLNLPRLQGDVDVLALRDVKTRVGRHQALRDLRAGRLSVIGATLNWVTPRLTETFHDGGTCTESLPVPAWGLGFGSFGPSRHGLVVTVAGLGGADSPLLGPGATDPLRTHCPGPEGPDALAPHATLASARIPVAALLRRHRMITLRTRGGFIVPGYDGTRNGELPATMSLLKIIAGTQTETEFSSL
jgi:hypothetical protein